MGRNNECDGCVLHIYLIAFIWWMLCYCLLVGCCVVYAVLCSSILVIVWFLENAVSEDYGIDIYIVQYIARKSVLVVDWGVIGTDMHTLAFNIPNSTFEPPYIQRSSLLTFVTTTFPSFKNIEKNSKERENKKFPYLTIE